VLSGVSDERQEEEAETLPDVVRARAIARMLSILDESGSCRRTFRSLRREAEELVQRRWATVCEIASELKHRGGSLAHSDVEQPVRGGYVFAPR
jgi:hypothetical protein